MAVPLEKFVQQLEDSGIVAGETLKDFLPPKASPKSAEELALELVRKKKLTKFQAEEVSKGKGKSLVLGNYVLMEKIGAGGMGQVFKAEHRRMHRIVAIKVLPSNLTKDEAAIARFEREVTAAAKLNHPNIVTAHDADEAGGVHFLVMELVEGSDLSALVKKNGPLPLEKAVNYVLQAARGLEAAHDEGIVHRDIKPANLLLDKKGTVKILDMGLARIHGNAGQAELTSTGSVMGTVDYMAPEQALNTKTADARADIYALGCSMYYLLTGNATFEGDTLMAKLLAHRDHPIPSLRSVRAEIPEQVEAVFKKMVAKKVEDRYQTMREVIAELESWGSGQSRTFALQSSDAEQSISGDDNFVSSRTTTLPQATRQPGGNSSGSPATKTVESLKEANFTDFLDNLPAIPTKPIHTKKLSKKPVPSGKNTVLRDQKKLLLIGGAVLGVLLLLAGVVINMKTKDGNGTLVVTVNEPDAEVEVLNEKDTVEITRKGDTEPIRITVVPGKHRLKVQKDGFEIFTESFEIKSGKSELITAELKPLVKVAVAGSNPWKSPAFEEWMKDVQAMPPEKQVEAVSKKLMELNPGFNENLSHKIEDGVVKELTFVGSTVTDLSPLRALTGLQKFLCGNVFENRRGELLDISPLQGLPLRELALTNSRVSELSPLKGMPLTAFVCSNTEVSDLTPLRGMALVYIGCTYSQVRDLSPIQGMPLRHLDLHDTPLFDLSPLRGMSLKSLTFTPKNITKGIDAIRQMKSLDSIGLHWNNAKFSPEEFWKKYDAGEFATPTPPSKPLAFQTSAFDQWMKDVQTMPAEKQVEAVSKKLMELNPGFDGKVTPTIEGGVATELQFVTDNVTDISPVRTLSGLKVLNVQGSLSGKGRLRDLSPISGMELTRFVCGFNPDLSDLLSLKGMSLKWLEFHATSVFDLATLKGMPLELVSFWGTKVTDLSPLQGMRLAHLNCVNTQVFDLKPLEGMPLTFLDLTRTPVSDISPLRGMKLTALACSITNVADLSPLNGMPLTLLFCAETKVSDLSPLSGMKLEEFFFTPKSISKGIDNIRQMTTLKTIATEPMSWGVKPEKQYSPEEFWKKYDGGEFGKP